jgi:hypothetical protein
MTATDIDTLYTLVSEVIRRAEVLEDLRAPGATDAYRDVSRLEERIAGLVPPIGVEGVIARRGAVTAAISGKEPRRAIELVDRFRSEPDVDSDLAAELTALRARAETFAVREGGVLQSRYSAAYAQYGVAAIQSFIQAYRQQGAPLPIR